MKKYLTLLLFTFLPSLLLAQAAGGAIKRPVKKKTEQRQQQSQRKREAQRRSLCPDSNHPHVIDLGLPSGTKWSCCNVGSSKPEGYGNYYAWGETKTESGYQSKDVSDIAGTRYDAATANWGAPWKMPTKAQCEELIKNTTYKWTTHNGVKGGMFMSKKNGRTLFLPAAGDRWPGGFGSVGSKGYYWSSTPYDEGGAYGLSFYSGSAYWYHDGCNSGLSVRPVR